MYARTCTEELLRRTLSSKIFQHNSETRPHACPNMTAPECRCWEAFRRVCCLTAALWTRRAAVPAACAAKTSFDLRPHHMRGYLPIS